MYDLDTICSSLYMNSLITHATWVVRMSVVGCGLDDKLLSEKGSSEYQSHIVFSFELFGKPKSRSYMTSDDQSLCIYYIIPNNSNM